jgi:hypothetical protein
VTARARLIAVAGMLLAGAIGIISSTQTWLTVSLSGGATPQLPVPGAAAIPVLAPLSLAVLALGAALSIVGLVLRYVFGALAVLVGGTLLYLTAQVAFTHPVSAVASTVTSTTGIAGREAVARLITGVSDTAWPIVTLVGWLVLLAAGILTLVTARRWRGSGSRYRTSPAHPPATGPLDAVDSWDGLTRGEDPTAGTAPR